jgi:hypothetical protein
MEMVAAMCANYLETYMNYHLVLFDMKRLFLSCIVLIKATSALATSPGACPILGIG